MAEIKIDLKKPVWPWMVVVLLVIAVLLYLLVFRDEDYTLETVAPSPNFNISVTNVDLIAVRENNSTVAEYINFIASDTNKMSLDHAFTFNALMKLHDATKEMGIEVDYNVQNDIELVRELANKITIDPFVSTHADNIRAADDILTDALQSIQKAKYPTLAAEAIALRNAAEAIKPDILTLDQKVAVKDFFYKAADLLQKMN